MMCLEGRSYISRPCITDWGVSGVGRKRCRPRWDINVGVLGGLMVHILDPGREIPKMKGCYRW